MIPQEKNMLKMKNKIFSFKSLFWKKSDLKIDQICLNLADSTAQG